jgi:plasmid maintenance system antidote protein VapI
MIELSQYLERHQLSSAAFAAKIGVAASTIFRILNGERECGVKLALRIERGTEGQVKASSLLAERLRRSGLAA